MTQEEKWMKNYHAVMEYMETNKRNPSKYDITVRSLYTWIKHQRKVMNAGKMKFNSSYGGSCCCCVEGSVTAPG